MPIKKPKALLKKRPSQRKIRLTVDPVRLAVAAMDRIRDALIRAGHGDRVGEPTAPAEIAARAAVIGRAAPPSYVAALGHAGRIGDQERLLDAREMRDALERIGRNKPQNDRERYVPFAVAGGAHLCFDKEGAPPGTDELPVVEWGLGSPRPRFRSFAEWLDAVADAREESLESQPPIPERLRALLADLGFRFDYPVVGRLETGDVAAIEELLGPAATREVRGEVDRVFDSSGKASLTLNVDEFTLAASLRTGIFLFEAEDVFRWLRYFRDENFFGDNARPPSHPDNIRDLRLAPREPPLVLRGVTDVVLSPAKLHLFRGATGAGADDFYVLGRTSSTSERSPSVLLHVVGGKVESASAIDEPLTAIHAAPEPDGSRALWGLSMAGTAVRFQRGQVRSFPLARPTRGRTWWHGIGGHGARVLVWGAGALLAFDGERFAPFAPDAELDESESIVALSARGPEIAMLVCGDHVGAVARFDGAKWAKIPESHVIEAQAADLDVWRGAALVLARDGRMWQADGPGAPRIVAYDASQEAFVNEAGGPRPLYGARAFDGGAMFATDGGVIVAKDGAAPVFHSAGPTREPARVTRVGDGRADLVAVVGPHVWVWRGAAFEAVDVREW